MSRIHGWSAWSGFLVGTQISDIRRHGEHSSLRTNERNGCNGTRNSATEHFCMEYKALIYVKDGQSEKAMQIFQQMQWEEISPDKLTFLEVINACAGHLGVLEDCRLVHEQLIQTGCNSDLFVRVPRLTCMQNLGALRMLGESSADAILRCCHLDHHDTGTCEMWARAEGTGNILTNATGRCAKRLCYVCGGAECLCQCSWAWRGQECSWADHSKWLCVYYLCGE